MLQIRNRFRSTPLGGSYSYKLTNKTFYYEQIVEQRSGAVSASDRREYEHITDTKGDASSVKPVTHLTWRIFQVAKTFSYSQYGNYIGEASGNCFVVVNSHNNDVCDRMLRPVDSSFIGQYTVTALKEWSDVVPEQLSIANFLYELKELPSLLLKFQGMKTIPNGLLSYEFGWKPLISDIQTLRKLIPAVVARLEFLRATNGVWRQVRFKRNFYDTQFDLYYGGQDMIAFGHPLYAQPSWETQNYKGSFTAQAKIRLSIEGINSDIAILKAFASALGLNNPGKIIWNALPYSFVVDWFVNLSTHFANPLRIYNTAFEVKNFCWSYKDQAVRAFYGMTYPEGGGSSPNYKMYIGSIPFKRYQRGTTITGIESGSLQFSSLSAKQKVLLAALASQRLRF